MIDGESPLEDSESELAAQLSRKIDADKTLEEQTKLFNTMRDSGHWSPFEHQAQAKAAAYESGNFRGGWAQYRTMFPNENRTADLEELLANKPDWITL